MKLLSSQAFYRSLFDNMLDGLAYCQMIFDDKENPIDFICMEVNKNFEKLTGLQHVEGKKATQILPDILTTNPDLLQIYGRVSLTQEPQRFETYIPALDRWFSVSVYSPKKKFFVIVFQNITGQKEIEKNLENSKIAARNVLEDLSIEKSKVEMARAKEEAILLSIGDGLIATDEKGIIVHMNKVALKLLGRKNQEFIGKTSPGITHIEDEKGVPIPPDKNPITMALQKAATTFTTTAPPSYYFVRKDGTKFPVAIMVTPVILKRKVIGAIEVFRDITREKAIDRAKSEFVSLASHQLRTPLTTVSWYTEMILNGDVGEVVPSQKKYLQEIYTGNKRMIELVNTLLNVSRIEMGTFKVFPEETDIRALAESVLHELRLKIEEKKLVIIAKFDAHIPILSIDPNHLRMVFQNLLSNAIEYTPAGGKIEFAITFEDTKNLSIQISDTGYGIPEKDQDQVFTKLFRADNIRDKDTDGTGLGLYIVKSVVVNSGGKVWFESEENKGTTFFVSLPITK